MNNYDFYENDTIRLKSRTSDIAYYSNEIKLLNKKSYPSKVKKQIKRVIRFNMDSILREIKRLEKKIALSIIYF
jgi:hypothetical protein